MINKIHSGHLSYLQAFRARGQWIIKAFRVFPLLLGEISGQRETGTSLIHPSDSDLPSSKLPPTVELSVIQLGPGCAGKPAGTDLCKFALGVPCPLPPRRKSEGRTRRETLRPPTPVNFCELFFPRGNSSRDEVGPAPGHFPRPVPSWCQDRIRPLKTSDVSKCDGN